MVARPFIYVTRRPRRHRAPGAAGDPPSPGGSLRHSDPRRGVGAQRPRGLARHRLRRAEAAGAERAGRLEARREHARARRPRQAVLPAEAEWFEGAPRIPRDVPVAVARLRVGAGQRLMLFARFLPAADRDAILGDLFEEAEFRNLRGRARSLWLAGECAAIAAGLSLERVRGWFVMPPMREVVSGLAIERRGVLRGGAAPTLLRALLFVASVTTLVLGVELLVGTLMSAAGF